MRTIAFALTTTVIAVGLTVITAGPAQATVLEAKLYAGQAFDVQRGPAWPTCTDGTPPTFDEFSVSGMTNPYSSPTGSTALGSNYLKLEPSGDPNHPWRLALYNPSDQELRYDSGTSMWVPPTDSAWSTAAKWNEGGDVYGLYADGYFFDSSDRGNGTFISLTTTYPDGGSTSYTPTSDYNDCVYSNNLGGWYAMGKGSAIDPSGGGDGGGTTPDPVIDLVLDLQVGAKLDGATTTISGDGLKANSAYDLTMHSDPVVLTQGTTDGAGAFSETVTIPTEACMPGLHELTLTGTDPSDNPVSDTTYLELATDCTVMQVSDSALTASMPDTGVSIRNGIMVGVSALVFFGLALFVYRSRRRLRFASVNNRIDQLMGDLDARLQRMEARAKQAAARRHLRR